MRKRHAPTGKMPAANGSTMVILLRCATYAQVTCHQLPKAVYPRAGSVLTQPGSEGRISQHTVPKSPIQGRGQLPTTGHAPGRRAAALRATWLGVAANRSL